jgi:hypothetical protein
MLLPAAASFNSGPFSRDPDVLQFQVLTKCQKLTELELLLMISYHEMQVVNNHADALAR